jgi:hypothetical protein
MKAPLRRRSRVDALGSGLIVSGRCSSAVWSCSARSSLMAACQCPPTLRSGSRPPRCSSPCCATAAPQRQRCCSSPLSAAGPPSPSDENAGVGRSSCHCARPIPASRRRGPAAPGDDDAPRRQVRVQRVRPCGCHDHVVAGKPGGIQPSPRESHRGLHRRPGLPHRVEPLALGHAVQGGMDRLSPAVAVPRPPPTSNQRRVPAGCTWNPGRWSVRTRSWA